MIIISFRMLGNQQRFIQVLDKHARYFAEEMKLDVDSIFTKANSISNLKLFMEYFNEIFKDKMKLIM